MSGAIPLTKGARQQKIIDLMPQELAFPKNEQNRAEWWVLWRRLAGGLTAGTGDKLFANVYLDPKDKPKSIMLQFHKGGWNHRAVWGDYHAIEWGTKNGYEKVYMGPLPKADPPPADLIVQEPMVDQVLGGFGDG